MYRSFCLLLAAVLLISTASEANAALMIGDPTNFLGSYTPPTPSNPAGEVANINILKGVTLPATMPVTIGDKTYDRTLSSLTGTFPVAVVLDGFKDESPSGAGTTLPELYHYVLGKYGAGPSEGGSLVWYSPFGFTGSVTLPGKFEGDTGPGLSHISAFNVVDPSNIPGSVPEPASLVVWAIGFAFCGGYGLRRRRLRSA